MTREEAKDILMLRRDMHEETAKALDMAIEALSVSREQPDYCIAYGSGVCGYPIEECAECPKHDYYKCLPDIVRCKDCRWWQEVEE